MRDLVTAIIPVFNGSEFLGEAIDSVLGQTYNPIEIIVVDDGSTDDSSVIAQSYGDHLTYHYQENRGVAAALNRGIRESRGRYIAWLSHDDLFEPQKIERQIDFLGQHPEFRACYSDFDIIGADGETIRKVETPWFPHHQAIWELLGSMYINGSSMLIERTCFDDVGFFNEALKYTQDTDMWMRMLLVFDIGRIQETLLKWRSHPGQGSREAEHHNAERWTTYRRIFADLVGQGLYPAQITAGDEAWIKARAYLWLGDTMVANRKWYGFAVEQYARSLRLWPSLQNPAAGNLAINWMRDVYLKTRLALGRLLRTVQRSG